MKKKKNGDRKRGQEREGFQLKKGQNEKREAENGPIIFSYLNQLMSPPSYIRADGGVGGGTGTN